MQPGGGGPEINPFVDPNLGPGGLPRPENNQLETDRLNRARGLPIGAEDLIEGLQNIEVGEGGNVDNLRKVVYRVLAYKEGLKSGLRGRAYELHPDDPNDTLIVANMQNLLTTAEGAMARPQAPYLDIALEEAIDGRIRRAEDYHDDPALFENLQKAKLQREYEARNQSRMMIGQAPLRQEEIGAAIQARIGEEKRALDNEYAAIPELTKLKSHIDARKVSDQAFIYRMYTCEDPGDAGNLLTKTKTSPDGSHWVALFDGERDGEFGHEVNTVFEEIVKFGLDDRVVQRLGMAPIPAEVRRLVPHEVYASGFDNGKEFAVWFSHLLNVADGRMDVLWNAWKFALTTETIDKLGEFRKGDEWLLAVPPIGNALFTFTAHLEKKRASEFGLNAGGAQGSQTEKFLTHSGLPLTIDKIPNLCVNYLEESSISFDRQGLVSILGQQAAENMYNLMPNAGDPDYDPKYDALREQIIGCWNGNVDKVKITLWDIWLYGRVGFSDSRFPWYNTDQPSADASPGELPSGSYAGWLLKRFRCGGGEYNVLKDVRSMPTMQDISNPEFFALKLRNWAKVLGKIKADVPPEENPRMWWVASIVSYHYPATQSGIPKDRQYTNIRAQDTLERREVGHSEKNISVKEVLENAIRCGFLRPQDVKWIETNVGT